MDEQYYDEENVEGDDYPSDEENDEEDEDDEREEDEDDERDEDEGKIYKNVEISVLELPTYGDDVENNPVPSEGDIRKEEENLFSSDSDDSDYEESLVPFKKVKEVVKKVPKHSTKRVKKSQEYARLSKKEEEKRKKEFSIQKIRMRNEKRVIAKRELVEERKTAKFPIRAVATKTKELENKIKADIIIYIQEVVISLVRIIPGIQPERNRLYDLIIRILDEKMNRDDHDFLPETALLASNEFFRNPIVDQDVESIIQNRFDILFSIDSSKKDTDITNVKELLIRYIPVVTAQVEFSSPSNFHKNVVNTLVNIFSMFRIFDSSHQNELEKLVTTLVDQYLLDKKGISEYGLKIREKMNKYLFQYEHAALIIIILSEEREKAWICGKKQPTELVEGSESESESEDEEELPDFGPTFDEFKTKLVEVQQAIAFNHSFRKLNIEEHSNEIHDIWKTTTFYPEKTLQAILDEENLTEQERALVTGLQKEEKKTESKQMDESKKKETMASLAQAGIYVPMQRERPVWYTQRESRLKYWERFFSHPPVASKFAIGMRGSKQKLSEYDIRLMAEYYTKFEEYLHNMLGYGGTFTTSGGITRGVYHPNILSRPPTNVNELYWTYDNFEQLSSDSLTIAILTAGQRPNLIKVKDPRSLGKIWYNPNFSKWQNSMLEYERMTDLIQFLNRFVYKSKKRKTMRDPSEWDFKGDTISTEEEEEEEEIGTEESRKKIPSDMEEYRKRRRLSTEESYKGQMKKIEPFKPVQTIERISLHLIISGRNLQRDLVQKMVDIGKLQGEDRIESILKFVRTFETEKIPSGLPPYYFCLQKGISPEIRTIIKNLILERFIGVPGVTTKEKETIVNDIESVFYKNPSEKNARLPVSYITMIESFILQLRHGLRFQEEVIRQKICNPKGTIQKKKDVWERRFYPDNNVDRFLHVFLEKKLKTIASTFPDESVHRFFRTKKYPFSQRASNILESIRKLYSTSTNDTVLSAVVKMVTLATAPRFHALNLQRRLLFDANVDTMVYNILGNDWKLSTVLIEIWLSIHRDWFLFMNIPTDENNNNNNNATINPEVSDIFDINYERRILTPKPGKEADAKELTESAIYRKWNERSMQEINITKESYNNIPLKSFSTIEQLREAYRPSLPTESTTTLLSLSEAIECAEGGQEGNVLIYRDEINRKTYCFDLFTLSTLFVNPHPINPYTGRRFDPDLVTSLRASYPYLLDHRNIGKKPTRTQLLVPHALYYNFLVQEDMKYHLRHLPISLGRQNKTENFIKWYESNLEKRIQSAQEQCILQQRSLILDILDYLSEQYQRQVNKGGMGVKNKTSALAEEYFILRDLHLSNEYSIQQYNEKLAKYIQQILDLQKVIFQKEDQKENLQTILYTIQNHKSPNKLPPPNIYNYVKNEFMGKKLNHKIQLSQMLKDMRRCTFQKYAEYLTKVLEQYPEIEINSAIQQVLKSQARVMRLGRMLQLVKIDLDTEIVPEDKRLHVFVSQNLPVERKISLQREIPPELIKAYLVYRGDEYFIRTGTKKTLIEIIKDVVNTFPVQHVLQLFRNKGDLVDTEMNRGTEYLINEYFVNSKRDINDDASSLRSAIHDLIAPSREEWKSYTKLATDVRDINLYINEIINERFQSGMKLRPEDIWNDLIIILGDNIVEQGQIIKEKISDVVRKYPSIFEPEKDATCPSDIDWIKVIGYYLSQLNLSARTYTNLVTYVTHNFPFVSVQGWIQRMKEKNEDPVQLINDNPIYNLRTLKEIILKEKAKPSERNYDLIPCVAPAWEYAKQLQQSIKEEHDKKQKLKEKEQLEKLSDRILPYRRLVGKQPHEGKLEEHLVDLPTDDEILEIIKNNVPKDWKPLQDMRIGVLSSELKDQIRNEVMDLFISKGRRKGLGFYQDRDIINVEGEHIFDDRIKHIASLYAKTIPKLKDDVSSSSEIDYLILVKYELMELQKMENEAVTPEQKEIISIWKKQMLREIPEDILTLALEEIGEEKSQKKRKIGSEEAMFSGATHLEVKAMGLGFMSLGTRLKLREIRKQPRREVRTKEDELVVFG